MYVKREKVSIGKVKEETFPTIEEIFEEMMPEYVFNIIGEIIETNYLHKHTGKCMTKEQAQRQLAFGQLLVIADYYNSKFPDEKAEYVLHRYKEDILLKYKDANLYGYYKIDELMSYGDPLFTLSAAKEALRNPNIIEVLKVYLQVKD